MLTKSIDKVKRWGSVYRTDIILGLSVILISLASFGLGRLSVIWVPKTPVKIIMPSDAQKPPGTETGETADPAAPLNAALANEGKFVASKNGSAYYLIDCSSAQRIKPENRIFFTTENEARASGYRPAANCPGLSGN